MAKELKKADAVYFVAIRPGLPPLEQKLLSLAGTKIGKPPNALILGFNCTDIGFDGPYLTMQTFKEGDRTTFPVRIPHHFVLAIFGGKNRSAVGFLKDASA